MRLDDLWKIGVTDNLDLEDRKQIIFSNGVYFIVISVFLSFEIATGRFTLFNFQRWTIPNMIPSLLIMLAVVCVTLNALKIHALSRVLFVISWTMTVSVIPFVVRGTQSVSYLTHPFYLILFSPVIHLLFSGKNDRPVLYFFLIIYLFFTFFSADFLMYFDSSEEPKVPFVQSLIVFKAMFLLLWFFINLIMAYVMQTNSGFYQSLREQKELVHVQQLQLQSQNEKLIVANQELVKLNDQIRQLNEVLEKRVDDRTRELMERNKILSDYAFMNAHLLRSPVSRIKGLIHLFHITQDLEEKKKVQEILLQSAEDLDQVVHSISERLNNTGDSTIKPIT